MIQTKTNYKLVESKNLQFGLFIDDKLIGVAIADISTTKPSAVWWIGRLQIFPEHRGQGHGSALLEMVCQELFERGCLPICINPCPQAFGFQANSLEEFERSLETGGKFTRDWLTRHGFVRDEVLRKEAIAPMIRYPEAD